MKPSILSGAYPGVLLVFACISAGAGNPVFVKKLTFEQAVETTWENSHVLKQAGYLRQQQIQERHAARGLYFPTIGITASAMVMSDAITLDLTPVRDAITPLYRTLGTYGKFGNVPGLNDDMATQLIRQKMMAGLSEIEGNNWNQTLQEKSFGLVAATFQWPVYAGGKIRAANKAAVIKERETNEILKQKQGELMTELAERYYGLSLASQVVEVRKEVFAGLQQHLEDAAKLEKEGMISAADVLHARVVHAQASRELAKAMQQAVVAASALNATMATGDSARFETVSSLFYNDSIKPESWYLETARSKNPLLGQIATKKLLVAQSYRAVRADLLPAIAFQGTYDIVNKDLSEYLPDWVLGVGLKWTLFDGASGYARVKAASLQTKQVEETGLKANDDIVSMIHKLYGDLSVWRDQLHELETARRYAEEYLRARETEFHQEISNSTQVIDARLALAQVKTERLQVIYNYDVTLARLLEYTGVSGDFPSYATRVDAKTENYR
jgi:outer membrane protein TolC